MYNRHLGLTICGRLERYGHELLGCSGFDLPGVDEFPWTIDHMKSSCDPQHTAIWKTIPDPVTATDSQVDFCFNAGNRLRAPPLFELFRFGPGGEEAFGRGRN